MKADRRTQLEQVLNEARQLVRDYEHKIALESDPARKNLLQTEYKKTQQRIQEFEELLHAYSPVVASTVSRPPVEQQAVAPLERRQESAAPVSAVSLQVTELDRAPVALERLALPHWFTNDMLPLLLSDLITDQSEQRSILDELQAFRQVEIVPGGDRYRVPERQRIDLLKSWQGHDRRSEFIRLSALLANYCAGWASVESGARQNEWRCEQLYHLVVSNPEQAMQLLKLWFDESVETNFDLNQGYCWLLQLEERRQILAELESTRIPPARWTAELNQRHEYLTARAFWTEEWLRTINYQERDELKRRFPPPSPLASFGSINYQERDELKRPLEDFFSGTSEGAPWLLSLYAQGGYGKTATIQWLLARYLLPRGFVCARFDHDGLSTNERLEVFQQPDKILKWVSENLNAQRLRKIEAFQRQAELRSDPIGHFTLVLRETYGEKNVVLFIDTLEVLLEDENSPEAGTALMNLLSVLTRIRKGDLSYGGSTPGYANLRVVLSGRQCLSDRYAHELREALSQGNGGASLPLVELEVPGFRLEEARQYLSQKRKLSEQTTEQIIAVLEKATTNGPTGRTTASATNRVEIVPLKLAQYADLLKEAPTSDVASLLASDDIGTAYLVNRILQRIQNHAIRWLLRYGVIFRRLDAQAAQVLMPFLGQALAGHKELDDPDLDPPMVRAALAASREQAGKPVGEVNQLFHQLTRYSWVDRQGDYIKIHPEVSEPQLRIVAKQKIFKVLQQAAFEHYRDRVERSTDLHQQANYLREAIFHVLQIGEEGPVYWREQFSRYRKGPAMMLWTLVDETFIQAKHPWSDILLSDEDRFHAYLDLANILLAEKEQPFLSDQLAVAEKMADNALELAPKVSLKAGRFSTNLVLARIALAQHRLPEALDTAMKCSEQATSTDQYAEALVVLGEAEAANSKWEKALDTFRTAYNLVKPGLKGLLTPLIAKAIVSVYRLVQTVLIEQLLNSPKWRDALPLLDEARTQFPEDPSILANAARMAFKLARFKEATQLYQQAIERSNEIQSAKLIVEQQLVQLYQGKSITLSATDTSMLAFTAAALRGDWPGMESLLDAQLATATEAKTLETMNTLLQYYVEVAGNWQQVKDLLERGAKWVSKLPETDPAVARYDVVRQYIDFLNSPLVLKPDVARRERERRLHQISTLRTPEARVRAKGFLLLVRFYGGLVAEQPRTQEREAIRIYTNCAVEALDRTFDLLLELAPLDQVDIMRTLAALPGWSSALINDVTLDPSERSPLLLLAKCFARVDVSEQPSFLARLATIGNIQIEDRLGVLRRQIVTSGSDWPLLYTSFARLLAAFGLYGDAREFLREIGVVKSAQMPMMRTLVAQDQAFIASWEEGRRILAEAIAYLEQIPQAQGNLIDELQLIRAYLSLDKGITEEQWRTVFDQSTFLFFTSADNTRLSQDFHILRAVSSIRSGYFDEAHRALNVASDIALNLGNTYALSALRTAQNELRRVQQSRLEQSDLLEHPGTELVSSVTSLVSKTSTKEVGGAIEEETSALPPTSKTDDHGLEMTLQQMDETTIEVVLTPLQQEGRRFKTKTQLQGIKRLLPQGTSLPTLPDLDYWQKLLNADSNRGHRLEHIGATLLDDLLPRKGQGRSLLVRCLEEGDQSVRFIIKGAELERLPWSMLYDTRTKRWLANHCRLSYNHPPSELLTKPGEAIAILSAVERHKNYNTLIQIRKLYEGSAASNWFDSYELLGQSGPSMSASMYKQPFLAQVRLVHLVGDLSELDDVKGIFLNMGSSNSSEMVDRLTPDHLARRLRRLNISKSLIVLEPLSTGSMFEDVRVLMLRNSYAAALARLGPWTVLAIGPKHSSATTRMVERLLQADVLKTKLLENIVQEARQQTTLSSFSSLLEGQFELFYPDLL